MDTEMINGHELIDWILANGLHTKTTYKVIEHIEDMIRDNIQRKRCEEVIKARALDGKCTILRKI